MRAWRSPQAGRHYAARVWAHPDPERQPGLIGDGKGDVVTYGLPPGQGGPCRDQAAHMVRHDPARVLRDVEAKRRLIDAILRYEAFIDGERGCCHDAEAISRGVCPDINPDRIEALRLLALPYAEHADYRQEWTP